MVYWEAFETAAYWLSMITLCVWSLILVVVILAFTVAWIDSKFEPDVDDKDWNTHFREMD